MTAEILGDVAELAPRLRPGAQLAGLDVGDRTIGLAVSDALRRAATPIDTIRRKKFTPDAHKLIAALEGRLIGGWIVGLPVNMSGEEGPQAQSVRAFARNFSRLTESPIAFWDERLSSMAAERALLEADASRRRRSQVIDQVAAAYILQGALDRLAAMERYG